MIIMFIPIVRFIKSIYTSRTLFYIIGEQKEKEGSRNTNIYNIGYI